MAKKYTRPAQTAPAEKKYTREALMHDERFSIYQRDFLAAVLTEPEYTIAGAEKAVTAFFGKE